MSLICFASQRGSPGATTAALAVAAALQPGPGRRKLLVEADAAGGTLALRYRLPAEPGLVTLAAAVRGDAATSDDLWPHAVELPGGLPAVLSPDGPDQVHGALAAAGPQIGRFLAQLPDVDVICDVGRLGPGSPAVDLVAEATALLMVARPEAAQLQPAAHRLLSLRPRVRHLGWLLIGDKPHDPGHVEETFGFPVVGVIADDPRSVAVIEAGGMTRRIRRLPFVRSSVSVADTLGRWLRPSSMPVDTDTDNGADDEGAAGSVGLDHQEPEPDGADDTEAVTLGGAAASEAVGLAEVDPVALSASGATTNGSNGSRGVGDPADIASGPGVLSASEPAPPSAPARPAPPASPTAPERSPFAAPAPAPDPAARVVRPPQPPVRLDLGRAEGPAQ